MTQNMNSLDRRVRALLVAPAAAVAGILIGPTSAVAIVLYAVAAVMLVTSAAGRCPLYRAIRVGTRGRRPLAH